MEITHKDKMLILDRPEVCPGIFPAFLPKNVAAGLTKAEYPDPDKVGTGHSLKYNFDHTLADFTLYQMTRIIDLRKFVKKGTSATKRYGKSRQLGGAIVRHTDKLQKIGIAAAGEILKELPDSADHMVLECIRLRVLEKVYEQRARDVPTKVSVREMTPDERVMYGPNPAGWIIEFHPHDRDPHKTRDLNFPSYYIPLRGFIASIDLPSSASGLFRALYLFKIGKLEKPESGIGEGRHISV